MSRCGSRCCLRGASRSNKPTAERLAIGTTHGSRKGRERRYPTSYPACAALAQGGCPLRTGVAPRGGAASTITMLPERLVVNARRRAAWGGNDRPGPGVLHSLRPDGSIVARVTLESGFAPEGTLVALLESEACTDAKRKKPPGCRRGPPLETGSNSTISSLTASSLTRSAQWRDAGELGIGSSRLSAMTSSWVPRRRAGGLLRQISAIRAPSWWLLSRRGRRGKPSVARQQVRVPRRSACRQAGQRSTGAVAWRPAALANDGGDTRKRVGRMARFQACDPLGGARGHLNRQLALPCAAPGRPAPRSGP